MRGGLGGWGGWVGGRKVELEGGEVGFKGTKEFLEKFLERGLGGGVEWGFVGSNKVKNKLRN